MFLGDPRRADLRMDQPRTSKPPEIDSSPARNLVPKRILSGFQLIDSRGEK